MNCAVCDMLAARELVRDLVLRVFTGSWSCRHMLPEFQTLRRRTSIQGKPHCWHDEALLLKELSFSYFSAVSDAECVLG